MIPSKQMILGRPGLRELTQRNLECSSYPEPPEYPLSLDSAKYALVPDWQSPSHIVILELIESVSLVSSQGNLPLSFMLNHLSGGWMLDIPHLY
jgi:hypothetical protein